jgi:hypothetical protein
METGDSAAERKREVEERASRDMMRLLTLNLTSEGDAFLIGVGAVAAFVLLLPFAGVWATLAFPVVFAAAVFLRWRLAKRP